MGMLVVSPLILQIPLVYSTSDPLLCTKHVLDCYFKMTFKISKLYTGKKISNFKIHISNNPRHIDDFTMKKETMVRYLLPGEYRISVIFKDQNQGYFCVGIAKAGESRLCDNIINYK
jgi:hypothetical protein